MGKRLTSLVALDVTLLDVKCLTSRWQRSVCSRDSLIAMFKA